jgi:CO/xanthine dehydrogenase Mo-binding subunit
MPLDTNFTNQKFKQVGPAAAPRWRTRSPAAPNTALTTTRPTQLIALVLRSPRTCQDQEDRHLEAEKLPGVKAIITSADLPDLTAGDRGMRDMLENRMARKKVLYDGHAVAAVRH